MRGCALIHCAQWRSSLFSCHFSLTQSVWSPVLFVAILSATPISKTWKRRAFLSIEPGSDVLDVPVLSIHSAAQRLLRKPKASDSSSGAQNPINVRYHALELPRLSQLGRNPKKESCRHQNGDEYGNYIRKIPNDLNPQSLILQRKSLIWISWHRPQSARSYESFKPLQ